MLAAFPFEPTPLNTVVGAVFAYVGSVSAIGFVHPKLRRPENRRMRQAINSWWPTAIVCSLAAVGGRTIGLVLFMGLSAWALVEYLRLLPADNRPQFITVMAMACVPLQYLPLLAGRADLANGVTVLLWAFLLMPLVRAFVQGPNGFIDGSARVGFGVTLTVVALSYAPRLLLLPADVGPAGGAGMLAFLLVVIMMGDANQWVFGKAFGRHRMTPTLSPNKTWEGLAGGVAVAALSGAWLGPRVTPFSTVTAALVGGALCVLGLLGDLLISALKRDLGVKDTGSALPGQGGVLDRADSLLIAAPIFYYAFVAYIAFSSVA
jgi:phosphatidate cytidylyltransferase